MKKRVIGMAALAAAFSLSAGMTAFAGWVQEGDKWAYQYADGNWAVMGWFADPADGALYYMDPDGYIMTDTRVEGFRLGPDGKRIEKTAEELQEEAERAAREAAKPAPSKPHVAAEAAAAAAKNASTATATARLSYQAEMGVFMDKIFIDTYNKLHNIPQETEAEKNAKSPEQKRQERKERQAEFEANPITNSASDDNVETTYRYTLKDGSRPILHASIWRMNNKKASNYRPDALEISYYRNVLTEESHITLFNDTFHQLLVTAFGSTEGTRVYDRIIADVVGSGANYTENGATDTGNTYELTCRNDKITIKVTCSEAAAKAEEAAEAAQEQAAEATDTAEAETPSETEEATSSVIVAGQNNSEN